MAKKIRLDFSKTEERSGWNTRQIPEGLYKMKVESVQETEAQDGTAMLVYALSPVDSRYKSRRFPFYCKLQQNQLWKLRDLLVAAGVAVPKKAVQIDIESPVGKLVAAEVEDDNYNGNPRSSVNGIYGLDILDEDSPASDEEEYDDSEEDDEEFDDEESEDFEDETDDEDEELEEDDFDDEEFDEDDLDEEEDEEPEPAPKRRAPAKAPAKSATRRAPAKAAAPAKRVVRRR